MEVEGEDVVDKYVTRTEPKSQEIEHVGGSIGQEPDPLGSELKLNKHGIESGKEY